MHAPGATGLVATDPLVIDKVTVARGMAIGRAETVPVATGGIVQADAPICSPISIWKS